jgi:hypothetical protein
MKPSRSTARRERKLSGCSPISNAWRNLSIDADFRNREPEMTVELS